jgi:hypothetical protein
MEDMLPDFTGTQWLAKGLVDAGARVFSPELDTTVTFSPSNFAVEQNPIEKIELDFAGLTDAAFAMVKGRCGLEKMNRFGYRQIWIQPADDVNEADSFSLKVAPVSAWSKKGMAPRASDVRCVFETPNRQKGIRLAIKPYWQFHTPVEIDERLKRPPHFLHQNQREALVDQVRRAKQRQTAPDAGVAIDIDCYWIWVPKEYSIKEFVQESVEAAGELLQDVLAGEVFNERHDRV